MTLAPSFRVLSPTSDSLSAQVVPMARICYHRVLTRLGARGSAKVEEQNALIGALASSTRRSLTSLGKRATNTPAQTNAVSAFGT